MRMNDLDAVCCLKELRDYNFNGQLTTPKNSRPDTFWTCAFDHAIRALMERLGLKDDNVEFIKNPNGSYTARAAAQAGKPAKHQTETHTLTLRCERNGNRLDFCYRITTPAGTPAALIKNTIALGSCSEEINSTVASTCRAKGWGCELLAQNETKIPVEVTFID